MVVFRRGGARDDHEPGDPPEPADAFDPFEPEPDYRYEIRAEDLIKPLIVAEPGRLLRLRKQPTNAPLVQVEDAFITGRFDLRALDLEYLFRFERCRFEEPPDVREATLLGLVFRRCWLPGLKARNMRSRNDVRLIRCAVEVEHTVKGHSETAVQRGDDRERGRPDAAINLTDAAIEGSVVLTRTRIEHSRGKAIQADRLEITGALLAYRLEADGEIRVPGLKTGGNVNFSGATLHNPDGFALNGNGLHIGGSLLCEVDTYGPPKARKRFSANGIIYLPSAKVDSDIVLRGARLHTSQHGPIVVDQWKSRDPYLDPRPAISADRLRVDGNVELSDDFRATGTIRMVNAHIGGTLRLAHAEISVARGYVEPFYDRALHIDGTQINGDIEATNLNVPMGQCRLSDVTVGGNVLAWNATLQHHERDVFSARRAKIAGNLHLTDAKVEGTLRLQGIEVGGSIDLYGTEVVKPAVRPNTSFSVDVRAGRIGRDLVFTANRDRRFHAEGGVNLDGAVVARRVDLTGAVLQSSDRDGIALDVGSVTADEFALMPASAPRGQVVLAGAHCVTLNDNPELWEATEGLDLEDFRYDSMKVPIGIKDDAAVDQRIRLLRRAMGGYRPGPYDQLAEMLRTSGNEEHASTVLFKKQQFRYESLADGYRFLGPLVRLWSWLQRSMVGYGYRPGRAVGWLLLLLIAGSVWFAAGHTDHPCLTDTENYAQSGGRCAVNSDDKGLEWSPVLYTVDLLVPIVDFGNKGRWFMEGADKWVAVGFTAMGWTLATTVAAGVTRALRRN
ncbi:oxidoreductase [Amycolatopsis sp. 195334CR]|uniref:oxidoreductase n=1 Tax=Amycolatopsis sp. 195334CR TaxID=2814588 RepID=UPI001A900830|nr:oxidoreductase [Amycolatopsis sp. 195334CR]MBN6035755.1 oxidoreductase [Amycolatopsis sp. 195334CR]